MGQVCMIFVVIRLAVLFITRLAGEEGNGRVSLLPRPGGFIVVTRRRGVIVADWLQRRQGPRQTRMEDSVQTAVRSFPLISRNFGRWIAGGVWER